jgi:hypothetical protein
MLTATIVNTRSGGDPGEPKGSLWANGAVTEVLKN